MSLLLLGCIPSGLLDNQPCPCLEGWSCNADNICVLRDGGADSDGGDAGVVARANFFVSPEGDDALAGTTPATAKRTLAALASLVNPGDIIEIADGAYAGASCDGKPAPCFSGADALPRIDCDADWRDGTEERPIVIRAAHERQILFAGDGSDSFRIQNCAHYTIEGLSFRGDDLDGRQTSPFYGVNNDHLTLRRILGYRSNRCANSNVILNTNSQNLLIEESECYQFHRVCFLTWMSRDVIYRRNYVHSRDYNDASVGAACDPPYTGSAGSAPYGNGAMSCNNSGSCTYENNIVERSDSAFSTYADDTEGTGDDNLFIGNMAIDVRTQALQIQSLCRGNAPCLDSHIAERNRLEQLVVVDSLGEGTGSTSNGKINLVATQGFVGRGITIINVSRATEINCCFLGADSNCDGIPCADTDVSLTNYLAFRNGEGATVRADGSAHGLIGSWQFDYINSVGNDVDFSPTDFTAPNSFENRSSVVPLGMYDPDTGQGCKVYIPGGDDGRDGTNPPIAAGQPGAGLASNMAGAGEGGSDIGANIVFRVEGGVVTDRKLWDQETGAFPCGAIVPGLNDLPGASCFDAHTRLNVGNNGCDIP